LPGHPGFDIVDQLIGEKVYCLSRGPGNMWCKNEIGTMQVEQWIALPGWLDGEYVEARACNNAFFQGLNQRRLIDESTPRGVDQQRAALHPAQLINADHVARSRRQGAMQREYVRLGEYLIERG